MSYYEDLAAWKRRYFLDAIEAAGGNQCKAADQMGIHRNTVNRLLREAGLTTATVKLALKTITPSRKQPQPERRSQHAKRIA